jgi:tripartite-type tricarboxylate transporter receptor subunit TctC
MNGSLFLMRSSMTNLNLGELMNKYSKRVVALFVILCMSSIIRQGVAAEYPDRPIRFIVPFAAGSGPDVGARLLATDLSKRLGQQVVVDNRSGAGGSIGTEMIVRAPANGYTIGHGNIATLAINRSVLPKLPYDADKDLQKVVQAIFLPNIMAVSLSAPIGSVRDLIDYAKKSPGKLSYGATNGNSPHLSAEMFKLMTGTQIVHVSYKESPQAVTDLIGGRLQLLIENMSLMLPHVKAGRVRGIGVSGPKRSSAIPELPTVAEAGVAGFEVVAWSGVVVPVGVPRAIVDKLNVVVNAALAGPDLREKYAALGYELVGGTPEQFTEHVRKETAKWADVVKRAGVTVD